MPPDTSADDPQARHDGWLTLKRFLPYLWPAKNLGLRWRIVVAVLLIIAAKGTMLTLPFGEERIWLTRLGLYGFVRNDGIYGLGADLSLGMEW